MIKRISLLAAVCSLALTSVVFAAEEKEKSAIEFLEFSSELDNECQKRSPGGRIRLVRNLHPDKAIQYRFIRVFINVRQPGYARGVLEPGAEPTLLGCTKISGRDQTWEVQKAEFIQ